ncbi:hypothetical protein DM01DRAFT_1314301 [Hesseltinella vesiculosa]|uniref:Endonuclease/exonuclease/phosphatase domain-containing protein n=1 Tax=Hesseltinella vesiculosa TaxID=101127 RepID=A0A1X2GXC9_9FUNG|nr:hypothetical protein DM01DRAFT_1314301 [Hesseltinella vesiculosa]
MTVPSQLDDRVLAATVSHKDDLFDPIQVFVIYAPATYSPRKAFFIPSLDNLAWSRSWFTRLATSFYNTLACRPEVQVLPIFRRGSSSSVIDFIFCSPDLAPLISRASVEYVSASWTDHALLSIHLTTKPRRTSPYWRARPQLAALPAFQSHLYKALDCWTAS